MYIYTQTSLLQNDLDKMTLGQLNSYRFVKPKESSPIIHIIYKDNSRYIVHLKCEYVRRISSQLIIDSETGK